MRGRRPFSAAIAFWCSAVLSIFSIAAFSIVPAAAFEFEEAVPPYDFSFPKDHGAHHDYKQEWWYFTGHLKAEDGRRFGFEVTFFRQAVEAPVGTNKTKSQESLQMVHFAMTDDQTKKFFYRQKYDSGFTGHSEAKEGQLFVRHDNWLLKEENGKFLLSTENPNYSINFTLEPTKPPIIHGQQGVTKKLPCKGCGSHYYSFTNLKTTGTLVIAGKPMSVTGKTWMDHEYMSDPSLVNDLGWHWWGVQLPNNKEIMLYQFFDSNSNRPKNACGTFVHEDGTYEHLNANDFTVIPVKHWQSGISNREYVTDCIILIPKLHYLLLSKPVTPTQELITTGVTYLEADSTGYAIHWKGNKPKKAQSDIDSNPLAKNISAFASMLASGWKSFLKTWMPSAMAQVGPAPQLSGECNDYIRQQTGYDVNDALNQSFKDAQQQAAALGQSFDQDFWKKEAQDIQDAVDHINNNCDDIDSILPYLQYLEEKAIKIKKKLTTTFSCWSCPKTTKPTTSIKLTTSTRPTTWVNKTTNKCWAKVAPIFGNLPFAGGAPCKWNTTTTTKTTTTNKCWAKAAPIFGQLPFAGALPCKWNTTTTTKTTTTNKCWAKAAPIFGQLPFAGALPCKWNTTTTTTTNKCWAKAAPLLANIGFVRNIPCTWKFPDTAWRKTATTATTWIRKTVTTGTTNRIGPTTFWNTTMNRVTTGFVGPTTMTRTTGGSSPTTLVFMTTGGATTSPWTTAGPTGGPTTTTFGATTGGITTGGATTGGLTSPFAGGPTTSPTSFLTPTTANLSPPMGSGLSGPGAPGGGMGGSGMPGAGQIAFGASNKGTGCMCGLGSITTGLLKTDPNEKGLFADSTISIDRYGKVAVTKFDLNRPILTGRVLNARLRSDPGQPNNQLNGEVLAEVYFTGGPSKVSITDPHAEEYIDVYDGGVVNGTLKLEDKVLVVETPDHKSKKEVDLDDICFLHSPLAYLMHIPVKIENRIRPGSSFVADAGPVKFCKTNITGNMIAAVRLMEKRTGTPGDLTAPAQVVPGLLPELRSLLSGSYGEVKSQLDPATIYGIKQRKTAQAAKSPIRAVSYSSENKSLGSLDFANLKPAVYIDGKSAPTQKAKLVAYTNEDKQNGKRPAQVNGGKPHQSSKLIALTTDNKSGSGKEIEHEEVAWCQNFLDWWKNEGEWLDKGNSQRIAHLYDSGVRGFALKAERNRWQTRGAEIDKLVLGIDSLMDKSKLVGAVTLPARFLEEGTVIRMCRSPVGDDCTMRILTTKGRFVNVNVAAACEDLEEKGCKVYSKIKVAGVETIPEWVQSRLSDIAVLRVNAPDPSVLIPIQNAYFEGKLGFALKGDSVHTDHCRIVLVNQTCSPLRIKIPKGQYFLPDKPTFQMMFMKEDREIDLPAGMSHTMEIPTLCVSRKKFNRPPPAGVCYWPDCYPDARLGRLLPRFWELTQILEQCHAFDQINQLPEVRMHKIAQIAVWNELARTAQEEGEEVSAATIATDLLTLMNLPLPDSRIPAIKLHGRAEQDRILAAADLVTKLGYQLVANHRMPKTRPFADSHRLLKTDKGSHPEDRWNSGGAPHCSSCLGTRRL